MIGSKLGTLLKAAGPTAYAGPPTGYVVTFSNGLKVYLSGDTGITAEQETVVRDHYAVQLAVMNIGDTFTTGPTEAAFVVTGPMSGRLRMIGSASRNPARAPG